MKKGISIWSFTGQPLETCFQMAKSYGYDGVEVALAETGEINLSSTEADMAAIKEAASRQGIKLFSVASGLYWTYSLSSDLREEREKAKSIVIQQLKVAAWLGCDTILVIPGSVKCGFSDNAPIVPYDVVYDRALEALKELAPVAEELGVAIGLENVWNQFLMSPLEMRGLIDQIGSPAVGAYFDAGNVQAFGYPEQWVRILGKRIRKVHIKDFRAAAAGLAGFVDLLAGDVNFPAVMAALGDIGYDDWITAEMGVYRHYPETILQNTSAAMDKILGRA
jgi:hexulose-6-phosphate isomerase